MFSPKLPKRNSGYTLVEVLTAAAVFGFFGTALLLSWAALGTSSLNTLSYCRSENDQVRCFDYLRRDIRRASSVTIYGSGTFSATSPYFNPGGSPVIAPWSGTILAIKLPQYYSDTSPEDYPLGPSTPTTPTASGNTVTYGTPIYVYYYISNGVIMRNENTTVQSISDGGSVDSLFFYPPDTNGLIRCTISYTQTMRSENNRKVQRVVDIRCGQRSTL